jgi:hypothetical protein
MVSPDAPPWAVVSRYPGQSSPAIATGERGGRDLEHQGERVDRQCDRLPQLQQPGCICGHLVIMQAQH